MKSKNSKALLIFSAIFYIVTGALMIWGSFDDVKIDLALYNPENTFARLMEAFGQFVYWAIWGTAFAIIFVCRRDLNENLELLGNYLPIFKPVQNTDGTAYKLFNFIVKAFETVGFFALCGIGWKKLIENATKNVLLLADKENLSQGVYFAVSFVVAAISIVIVSRIDKKTLKKLEGLAVCGVVFGILTKLVEELKPLSERVRFREMVAYSNGFLNEDGLSEGKNSPLTRDMAAGSDFSAFTPWYKKGDDMGIYNRADSFPSGHTGSSCAVLLSVLLCTAFDKLKKLAPFALCVSVMYIYIMGYTRLVVGAHYLTDVSAAALGGYTIFLIVRFAYNKLSAKQNGSALSE